MGVKYGGSQPKMRDTEIKEVGPYRKILNVGDVQKMVFTYINEYFIITMLC